MGRDAGDATGHDSGTSLAGGTTAPTKTFWDESSEPTELLPARIKEDDGTPFILHDDVEHRDKVRRSLESRETPDADDLLELRRLSQAQLALLKVWLASAPSVAAAPAAASLPATTFAAYGGTSPASKNSGQTTKTSFFANPGIG